jgi:hypothetical protein
MGAAGCVLLCATGVLSFSLKARAQKLEPGLNIDSRTPGFAKRVNDCLTELSAPSAGLSRDIVASVRDAQYYIVITPASTANGFDNDTRPLLQQDKKSLLGVNIFWNPDKTEPYQDGAPRVPCATLLHELQHARDVVRGVIHGNSRSEARKRELRAVWAENWYLWRKGKQQRRRYYPYPDPLPDGVIWPKGSPEPPEDWPELTEIPTPLMPNQVTLTIENLTPELVLIAGRSGSEEILCGGHNPYFRAQSDARKCTLNVGFSPERNPIAVPLVTLVAYFPSGDPRFPRGGRVVWTDASGEKLDCGGNAYSEYCQIAMGKSGSYGPGPLTRGQPASKSIRVGYAVSGVARRSTPPGTEDRASIGEATAAEY